MIHGKRKTISIEDVVELANRYMLESHDDCVAEREGVRSFVSEILMKTKNYQGYYYLTPQDMAASQSGTTWGVIHSESGNKFGDFSRIKFCKP